MQRKNRSTADVVQNPTPLHQSFAGQGAAHGSGVHQRRTVLEGALGPLVCDVFLDVYPRLVPSTIRLPSILRVPVRAESESVLQQPADELVFTSRPAPLGEPVPHRDALTEELAQLLTCDTARAAVLEARGSSQRAERRLVIRAEVPHGTQRAGHLHIRCIHGDASALRPYRRVSAVMPLRRRGRRAARVTPPPRSLVGASKGKAAEASEASEAFEAQFWSFAPIARLWQQLRHVTTNEVVRVGVGSLCIGMLMLGLNSTSTVIQAGRAVRTTARAGATSLFAGFRALLAADVAAGVSDFTEARAKFLEAERHLKVSTNVVQRLAASLDPAGRLESARTLLDVGEQTARLGEETAAVIQGFQRTDQPLTETLEQAAPKLQAIRNDLQTIIGALRGLSTTGWPAADAAAVRKLSETLTSFEQGLSTFLQSQTVVLELLGALQDRQYLILFENNRELRPTGGFIGSFALVDVSRGNVQNVHVDSIYNPDGQLKDFLVPPIPLQKITDRWFARDANWFADFRQSASKVAHLFERSGGPTADGVLAVTPAVLEDLLRLTGPIPMPKYNVTVTAETVVADTQRLVTYEYDRTRNEPKAFIADLLPKVLAQVASLPHDRWGDLLSTITSALDRKHLLVYFRDETAEDAVLKLGWGGALPSLPPPTASALTDHLGRFEANIGGHKTDLLIEQEADYDVTVGSDGGLVATLVVTRAHRGPKTGTPGLDPAEDPAQKVNIVYERTFVPRGSSLLEARGFSASSAVPTPNEHAADYETFARDPEVTALEQTAHDTPHDVAVAEEGGFTTFGGWVMTPPEETTVTVLRYRLPFHLPRPSLVSAILRYELFLTHQPGHLAVLTRATLRVPDGFRLAWTGPTSAVTVGGMRKATFAASVDRDAVWGAIVEEQ